MRNETRRQPAEVRRETIVRAAGPLFGANGYAGTRLDDVAAAAGVTKPIVYRHFDSKKGLYLALLEKHRDDLPTFIENVEPAANGSPEEVVRAILDGWLDYVHDNHHSWEMLFRDRTGGEEIQTLRVAVSVRAREVMADFITTLAGDRIPSDQIAPTAELLTSGLAGTVLWWRDHPDVPKETLVEVAMRFLVPLVVSRPRRP